MSTQKRKLVQSKIVYIPLGKASEKRPLVCVISGGQSGADEAALMAARRVGYATGGFSTKDIPAYNIKKVGDAQVRRHGGALVARSIANVDQADGTVAFWAVNSAGTEKTIGYCVSGEWRSAARTAPSRFRPLLVLDVRTCSDVENNAQLIANFVAKHNVETLNVAGHRSDERACLPGYSHLVEQTMVSALEKVQKSQANLKRRKLNGLRFA